MKLKYVFPLLLGALLVAGCSASGRDESGLSGADTRAPQGAAPQAPGGKTEDQAAEGVTATAAPVEGRSLIYRAGITVKVDEVGKATAELAALVSTAGGFVASEKRVADPRDAHATITVRVPAKEFPAVLEKISALGREQTRSSNVEDVTEAVVDLDTRIAAQRASVESVRKMFERATTLQDVVLLERELSQRQADLASLEAKKRRLDDLVALSTVTVTLAGPNTEIEEDPDPSFLGGLKSGWRAFVSALQVGSAVIGFLLPFLVALAIPIVAIVAFLKYRRRSPAG